MANIKRRMARKKINQPDFYVSAGCEDGDLTVIVSRKFEISSTTFFNTGLPDCDLPWLTEKIIARIEQSPCRDQEDALCIADQVILEQKPVLVSLADTRGNGKRKGRFIRLLS